MTHRKRIAVLGSTGSIGVSTLDVLSLHPGEFEVFALTAATRVEELLAQCVQFRPTFAVMTSPAHGAELARRCADAGLPTKVLCGPEALVTVAGDERVDIVMAAIVGAAGLASCMTAALAGKRLLLANKEALVVGGAVFMEAVRKGGARLLPIDSEHSAIFQSLPDDAGIWPQVIDKLLLTASGGPFRTRAPDTLRDVTPEQACAHPNWVMGRKISVDSATMMNKALEVIEARWLFDLAPEQVKVVIHPQSIIHSMVVCRDHSVLAQLGTPDMRVPIAYGLAFPERIESGAGMLDFPSLAALSFEPADIGRFPGLFLAWDALRAAPGSTAVLNAANEVAVAAFLDGVIRFDQIHRLNREAVEAVVPGPGDADSLDALLALDARARAHAGTAVRKMSR